MNRHQAIKLLTAKEVFDTLTDDELYCNGKYVNIYDIMHLVDVSKEEVDFVQNLSFKELSLLD